MKAPTYHPDGRPVGGTNGYPPEAETFKRYCLVRYVARQVGQQQDEGARTAMFRRFEHLPGVNREAVRNAMREIKAERATR